MGHFYLLQYELDTQPLSDVGFHHIGGTCHLHLSRYEDYRTVRTSQEIADRQGIDESAHHMLPYVQKLSPLAFCVTKMKRFCSLQCSASPQDNRKHA